MHTTRPNFWRDALFYAALAGALLVWLCMYLLFQPTPDPGWPLREPLIFLYPALLYPIVEELAVSWSVAGPGTQVFKTLAAGAVVARQYSGQPGVYRPALYQSSARVGGKRVRTFADIRIFQR